MTNDDKMLQLVLSDSNLSSFYEFNPNHFPTIGDALQSDNPVVVAVAKIITSVRGSCDKGHQKEAYYEVFNYLNQNII
jgi:hypothetical protein